MAEGKRSDSKRRGPASRPGASGRGRSRPAKIPAREPRRSGFRAQAESVGHGLVAPIRRAIAATTAQQNEQRLGLTARRAVIMAVLVCVLALTIAGPVRTYFAQRTEMKQLAASEKSLRAQIAELEGQKAKLADPVYIAAQARDRLGFVMPGEIPYQVQLPAGATGAPEAGPQAEIAPSGDPWYAALWHTIADTPHGPPAPVPPAPEPVVPSPPAPPPGG
ncbi:MAG: septum formation initiator family protein [Mycobacterium sp.]|nr:septum formation initiator family protein [Mycobacterium sp.]